MNLFIAIPLLDELDSIHSLLSCLKSQTYKDFSLFICVNQPEDWWDLPDKREICFRNQKTIELLQNETELSIYLIDKSSRGKAWIGKQHGVGYARKELFDSINLVAQPNDIIISLDGDTEFNPSYFEEMLAVFQQNPDLPAVSAPYYHKLTSNEDADRAILHYEIYMRYYLINLFRIQSPYNFTALGSAMAFRVEDARRIGGFSPKLSGEDFYFLQKMVKFKKILNYCPEKVYPAARFSDRVYFGTGPAMIKGAEGNWDSYPIYDYRLFDKIQSFFKKIPEIFQTGNFNVFKEDEPVFDQNLWNKLLINNKVSDRFIKAVYDNFDGLRMLQFLKSNQKNPNEGNELRLIEFLSIYYPDFESFVDIENFSFKNSDILHLNQMRNYLCKIEDEHRKYEYNSYR